jgi:hypothetical protein
MRSSSAMRWPIGALEGAAHRHIQHAFATWEEKVKGSIEDTDTPVAAHRSASQEQVQRPGSQHGMQLPYQLADLGRRQSHRPPPISPAADTPTQAREINQLNAAEADTLIDTVASFHAMMWSYTLLLCRPTKCKTCPFCKDFLAISRVVVPWRYTPPRRW